MPEKIKAEQKQDFFTQPISISYKMNIQIKELNATLLKEKITTSLNCEIQQKALLFGL